jgi:DNA-binding transcriptional LysR family regulator
MDRLIAMEAFVRVVDAGSFSEAARVWGRSKAVVSKYVSALEDHLDVQLLRRTTRSLSLTDAGRDYHARCVDLLGELEAMEAALHHDHAALRGTLRVSAPPGFAASHLHVMTSAFVAEHPEVVLDIDLTHRMVDLVAEGIDVAIRVTEPSDSSLVARKLAPAPLVAVASPAYLRDHGRPDKPRDLRGHACIVDTNFRDQHRWRFRTPSGTETVSVTGPFRVNNPLSVRELALADHGVALCPRFVVAEALETGTLVEVLKGRVAFAWSIYAVYPRRRFLSGRVRAYVDHLARFLAAA